MGTDTGVCIRGEQVAAQMHTATIIIIDGLFPSLSALLPLSGCLPAYKRRCPACCTSAALDAHTPCHDIRLGWCIGGGSLSILDQRCPRHAVDADVPHLTGRSRHRAAGEVWLDIGIHHHLGGSGRFLARAQNSHRDGNRDCSPLHEAVPRSALPHNPAGGGMSKTATMEWVPSPITALTLALQPAI